MSSKPLPPPEECAQCGADIPRKARACPECGADERTGWRETSPYDGIDLPESAFEESENDNGGMKSPVLRPIGGVAWYWWAVGLLLILILGLSALGLR